VERGIICLLRRSLTAALVLCAAVAAAQSASPNNGIKIGDGRLHPFLSLEGKYDSAIGYFGMPPQLIGDIGFSVRPGLRFELLNPNNIFTFQGAGEYVWFPGILTSASREASRFQADVLIDGQFNKQGMVELDVNDQLTRSDRTNNPGSPIGLLSLYNNLRVAVPIRPGGGAIEIKPKGAWGIEFFEPLISSAAIGPVSQFNYSRFEGGLEARWRFLPKTAVVFDSLYTHQVYLNGAANAPTASILRTQLGVSGLITSKVSLLLMAGYSGSYLTSTVHTFSGQAEVALLLSQNFNARIGYLRALTPVPVYGVMGDDRGYISARYGVGRFSVTGDFAIDYLSFYAGSNRNDLAIYFALLPQISIFSWWTVAAGYTLTSRTTNNPLNPGLPGSPNPQFVRHEVLLRLTFIY
jgi:hypothetical protein